MSKQANITPGCVSELVSAAISEYRISTPSARSVDRSLELPTQDYLEQFDAITVPCNNRLQSWIGRVAQRVKKSQRHPDFEIPKRVFGPEGTVIINHGR